MTDESNSVSQALNNLQQIKQGTDPRDQSLTTDTPLQIAKDEVDRLFREHSLTLVRGDVSVGIASWKGRHGVCKYNKYVPNDDAAALGQRVSLPQEIGTHAIIINRRLLEDNDSREPFYDTVRHELAHAEAYKIYGCSQEHNHNWKEIAMQLGADPQSRHHKRDMSKTANYMLYCNGCDGETYRQRLSKTVKRPFDYRCGNCGETLSSCDIDKSPPEETGVVDVAKLSWTNRHEWTMSQKN